jgi:ketosteroid isomerase-like protein
MSNADIELVRSLQPPPEVDVVGGKVTVLVRDRGISRHDGVEVDLRAASVWTMREGRIARAEFHISRDTARAAFEA